VDDITQFLTDLDKEVESIENEQKRLEAKRRLEEAMRVYKGEDELISSADLLELIKNEPEEEKFMSGIKGLDDILQGFRYNQLIVLAAPTKSGKTQFCVELCSRLEDTKPVFIPFEESAREIVQKFHDRNEEPPLFYTPKAITGNTLSWIEKKIVEGKVKFDSKLFFIDHLHFIVPFTSDRLDTRIGQTMRHLKSLAKAHNVIIILVAHLKKTNMQISPTLEDLRDSSFVAQEADTVIMMWRQAMRENGQMVITNNTMISVQANRRTGTTGNVKLTFENGHYVEYDWKDDDSTDTKPQW
jgi:replicative DNA helicase